MAKAQETILEIDFKALEHNYKYLKSKLEKKTKFLAVVKAFAYGSDAKKVALFLEKLNVDYFAVAYASEGKNLRDAGVTKPILVLHPQPVNFKTIIKYCLEPSLYSAKILLDFQKTAKSLNQINFPVHIKFNTGLNRLGFSKSDVNYIASVLQSNNILSVKSVFSHLSASEDVKEKTFTHAQIKHFNLIIDQFIAKIGYKPIVHLCNTSGVLNYPEAHYDMVRCGIGLYGFGNSQEENNKLIPITALKSIISQIHTIKKGTSVGYNRAYISTQTCKIATIPIGHADGLGRQYGCEIGCVYINNIKALIVGNVCMDMIMVDVSNIDCQEGDEVVIFDRENSAEAMANYSKTISYELITSISQRIKRKYLNDF